MAIVTKVHQIQAPVSNNGPYIQLNPADFFWCFPNSDTFFLRQRDQNHKQCWRCGCTIDLYCSIIVFSVLFSISFLMIPEIYFAFLIII